MNARDMGERITASLAVVAVTLWVMVSVFSALAVTVASGAINAALGTAPVAVVVTIMWAVCLRDDRRWRRQMRDWR